MMVFLWNRLTQGGLRERGGWTGRGENPRSLWRRLLQVPILLIPPTIIGTMTKTLCPGHEYMWYYITITMVWGGGRGFISTESKLASMAILDRTYLARMIFSYFVLKYKIIVCPFRDPRGGADPNEQTDSVRTPWTSSSAGSVSRSLFCLLLLSSVSLLLPASSLLLPSRLLWTLVAPQAGKVGQKRENLIGSRSRLAPIGAASRKSIFTPSSPWNDSFQLLQMMKTKMMTMVETG